MNITGLECDNEAVLFWSCGGDVGSVRQDVRRTVYSPKNLTWRVGGHETMDREQWEWILMCLVNLVAASDEFD